MASTAEIESQLRGFFRILGADMPDIGLLHPADPFLDAAGEVFRRQIFLTSTQAGDLMCLRPEFTIPVCQGHVASSAKSATHAYFGKVFRQRPANDNPVEFFQAGIEDIGNEDRRTADVLSLERAANALTLCDIGEMRIVTGDQAVFEALLSALELPAAWRKKLLRDFGDKQRLRSQIISIGAGSPAHAETLEAEFSDPALAKDNAALAAAIAGRMAEAGLPAQSGRTAEAIADRMIEKVALSQTELSEKATKTLLEFLEIDVAGAAAENALRKFEHEFEINLGSAVDDLAARFAAMADFSVASLRYSASFGRRLDYYTGFVFEIYGVQGDAPLVGGGRYDRLLSLLGSEKPVPAIGFSIWVDRVLAELTP